MADVFKLLKRSELPNARLACKCWASLGAKLAKSGRWDFKALTSSLLAERVQSFTSLEELSIALWSFDTLYCSEPKLDYKETLAKLTQCVTAACVLPNVK
eukprot:scaffold471358_cov50-Prasinocladus_malaysianus.AAC.1